ncbi:MAG: hypothetical protein K8F25_10860, partial [Fimbriimonadaceae bacterium]|nr:hypothetical protein [Alphaproteobacteria bacterium]
MDANPFDQFDSAPAVGASPPNPFDQFDEAVPATPPYDPRFPYSADNPPPIEKSRNAPYPTPDMPGAVTITGKGTGTVANPKREAELNALYGELAPAQANPFDQFDAVADPSYTGEAGKAFVRGAAQTIGSAGKGLSRLTSDDKRKVETVEAGIAGLASMTPEEATQFVRSIPEAMDIN